MSSNCDIHPPLKKAAILTSYVLLLLRQNSAWIELLLQGAKTLSPNSILWAQKTKSPQSYSWIMRFVAQRGKEIMKTRGMNIQAVRIPKRVHNFRSGSLGKRERCIVMNIKRALTTGGSSAYAVAKALDHLCQNHFLPVGLHIDLMLFQQSVYPMLKMWQLCKGMAEEAIKMAASPLNFTWTTNAHHKSNQGAIQKSKR